MEALMVHINNSCPAYDSVCDCICYVKLVKLVNTHRQNKNKHTRGKGIEG